MKVRSIRNFTALAPVLGAVLCVLAAAGRICDVSAEPTAKPECRPFNVLIRGQSLAPRIAHGAVLRAVPLGCGQPVRRDSVVFVKVAASQTPLAKVVKALPGDTLAIEPASDGGLFHVRIAGDLVKNSQGKPYALREAAAKVLQLYERDYNGSVPAEALLVLGDHPGGTLDSTRFGLVSLETVVGVQTE